MQQGRLAHLWYAWRLPEDRDEQISVHTRLSLFCQKNRIPMRITAEQDRRLMELCRHPVVSMNKSMLEFLLKEVLMIDSHRGSHRSTRISALVKDPQTSIECGEFIAAGYHVTDMRFLNGKAPDKAFEPFMKVLAEKLEARALVAAEERRQVHPLGDALQTHGGPLRPTPLAPYMRCLHVECKNTLCSLHDAEAKLTSGEWKIPSLSAFCDRMCPSHPHRFASSRLQGTAGIAWAIQRRTARKFSQDAHYNNAQGHLLRKHLLEMEATGIMIQFISGDDKCKIPVGQPYQLQTATTRSRRVVAGMAFAFSSTRLCAWSS
jgi:hypothetical protein